MVNFPKLPIDFMRADLGSVAPDLDLLIRQHGQPVDLTPRIVCPCADPSRSGGTGTADPACESCNGTGLAFLWSSTVKDLRAVVTGAETRKQLTPATPLTQGSIRITFPSDTQIVEGDLVRLSSYFQTTDLLREYRAIVGGIRLPFDAVDIEYAASYDNHDRLIELERGKDYVLDAEKNLLTFPRSGRVSDRWKISGRFIVRPYYLVQSIPSVGRGQFSTQFSDDGSEQFIEFPKMVMAGRADGLFGRLHQEVSLKGDAQEPQVDSLPPREIEEI